jgi:hypothetical protein
MTVRAKACRSAAVAVLYASCASALAQAAGDDTAFKAGCARCHVDARRVAAKIKGASLDDKRATLTQWLETHQKSDPTERPAIIDYLMSLVTL